VGARGLTPASVDNALQGALVPRAGEGHVTDISNIHIVIENLRLLLSSAAS
jgi:hypothetical protein